MPMSASAIASRPEREVAHRRAADLAQRLADGACDAEDEAARFLARHDQPVAGAARPAVGGGRAERGDAERFERAPIARGRGCAPRRVRSMAKGISPWSRRENANAVRSVRSRFSVAWALPTTLPSCFTAISTRRPATCICRLARARPACGLGARGRGGRRCGLHRRLRRRQGRGETFLDERRQVRRRRGRFGRARRRASSIACSTSTTMTSGGVGGAALRGLHGGPPRPRPRAVAPGGGGNRGWPSGPIHGGRGGPSGGAGGPSGGGGRCLRARRHRLELDPLDERRRVAEHRRDALAHRGGFGRGARGAARLDEHPVHAAPDVGGDALHPPADIDGALRRFAPRRVLERADPRAVGDERHRAQRDDRQQQEGDDQPGTESHLPEQSTAAGPGRMCDVPVQSGEKNMAAATTMSWI